MEEIQEYIQLNLTFRIIPLDKENNHIKALDGSKCTLKSRGIKNGREKEFLNNFDTITQKLGFLNNEQSKKGYFWEIFKILEKGLIIIFLTFYGDLIIIKRAYVFTIVFIYQVLTRKQYSQHIPQLNLIYELGTLICGASKVISIKIYQADQSYNFSFLYLSHSAK
ncbi:unnamed protein product [Paramecium primaurelia]|uniref:Uncharacterized protein n=1 Tax=Paramecium primaurelia TaxID=5886 RepID=A0A8S1MKM5_PARPR|nr:unnamed protein product [Paramecium primaurelia]